MQLACGPELGQGRGEEPVPNVKLKPNAKWGTCIKCGGVLGSTHGTAADEWMASQSQQLPQWTVPSFRVRHPRDTCVTQLRLSGVAAQS